jgi:hypothetical protein
VAIIGARDSLQQLDPPPYARKLHEKLVQLYDLDAALGFEAIIQQFLPDVRRRVPTGPRAREQVLPNQAGQHDDDRRAPATRLESEALTLPVAKV